MVKNVESKFVNDIRNLEGYLVIQGVYNNIVSVNVGSKVKGHHAFSSTSDDAVSGYQLCKAQIIIKTMMTDISQEAMKI